MKFKVGEKVKFLNEEGGGTVSAIIDSRMVKIETDDGFEMPVLTSELIKDFRAEQHIEPVAMPSSHSPPHHITDDTDQEEAEEERITPINLWGNIKEENGIYLAFVPHEQQWVLTGDLDLFLINHTRFEVLYNLFFEQSGGMSGIDFGSVPAGSKCLIETIRRDDIENRSKGFLQLMFHDDEGPKVIIPVHSVINVKPGRFFTEGSFRNNSLLQDKALIISIAPQTTFSLATGDEQEQKSGETVQLNRTVQKKEKSLIDKHKVALFEATVDLHIAELVDNIAGLSDHDMFNIQLDYFKKTLESAIRNEYRKVTYIHGVGNGVLKNAIVAELEEYEGLENKMASVSKFGVGAIDVLIKNRE